MKITNQTINIHSAVAVNIGDHSALQNIASIQTLLRQIDSSEASNEEKEEARSLLQRFLAHPLVAALVGRAVSLS